MLVRDRWCMPRVSASGFVPGPELRGAHLTRPGTRCRVIAPLLLPLSGEATDKRRKGTIELWAHVKVWAHVKEDALLQAVTEDVNNGLCLVVSAVGHIPRDAIVHPR